MGHYFTSLGEIGCSAFKFLFLCAKVRYSATFLISKYTEYPVITPDNLIFTTGEFDNAAVLLLHS